MVTSSDMTQLSETWIRILNKMDAMEKSPKDFGSGDLLHCSEIHTLMAIGKHPDTNITELARFLGISKSATSQMITRLLNKDLVEKSQNPRNNKEIIIKLSAKGVIAFLGHEQHHAKIYARMTQKLGVMNRDQFLIITRFLHAIEETTDEFMQDQE
ncbi:MAG TPA: MarR family transcriptional regulator [Methanospirillum sp.]|nr:MarR family transcriptional regulator [Methanospirillum sp.]